MSANMVRDCLRELEAFRLIDSACFNKYTKCIKSYSAVPDDM